MGMSMQDLFSNSQEEITDWAILDKLLNRDNVKMSTEIINPLAHSRLRAVARELRNAGMIHSSDAIDKFLDDHELHMVSYKRKRSGEIVDSFRELIAHNERMKSGDRTFGRKDQL